MVGQAGCGGRDLPGVPLGPDLRFLVGGGRRAGGTAGVGGWGPPGGPGGAGVGLGGGGGGVGFREGLGFLWLLS